VHTQNLVTVLVLPLLCQLSRRRCFRRLPGRSTRPYGARQGRSKYVQRAALGLSPGSIPFKEELCPNSKSISAEPLFGLPR
jgi:hypothetical protein